MVVVVHLGVVFIWLSLSIGVGEFVGFEGSCDLWRLLEASLGVCMVRWCRI